jgi:hypothetical protein
LLMFLVAIIGTNSSKCCPSRCYLFTIPVLDSLFYATRDVLAKNSWNLYKGRNNRKQETE